MRKVREPQSLLSVLDDIAMVLLAVVSAGLLALEYLTTPSVAELAVLDKLDIGIACIFLAEFVIKFLYARHKGAFFKSHWWELLASIPVTSPATQALRLLRLLRLIRLFRLDEGLHEIDSYLKRFVRHTHLLAVFIVWLSLVAAGTVSFYGLEHAKSAQHPSFFDSFWWAITTLMAGGYGDVYPTTVGGRLLAIVLIFCGVGLVGIFTALVASFFITDKSK